VIRKIASPVIQHPAPRASELNPFVVIVVGQTLNNTNPFLHPFAVIVRPTLSIMKILVLLSLIFSFAADHPAAGQSTDPPLSNFPGQEIAEELLTGLQECGT